MDYSKIAQEILGSSDTVDQIIESNKLDISNEDFVEEMLSQNIEYCDGCGTWLESCEIDDEEQSVICFTCTGREID